METGKDAFKSNMDVNRGIGYKPLESNQIRILTLKANPLGDAKVQCTLKHANLGSLDDRHSYIALSYAWGHQSTRCEVLVEDQPFSATENLEVALRHLRDAQNDIDLWVDAICINQNDYHEIDQQLPLMRDIFSQAKETRVWLGAEAHESHRAIDLINHLSDVLERSKYSGEEDDAGHESVTWGNSDTSRPWRDEVDLVAMHHLFTRPYFYRVWVVQEIATSREVIICCGRHKLPWSSVLRVAQFLAENMEIESIIFNRLKSKPYFDIKKYKSIFGGIQRICSIQSVRADILEPGNPEERPPDSLLFLLSSHRSTEASKPNDKYLALAGLVNEDPSITSQKSCASSVTDTYILAAKSMAKQQQYEGALDFLDFAGWPTNQKHTKGLPSWVPDWSYTRDRAVPLLYWQLAGEKHKDMVKLNASGRATASHPNTFSFLKKENSLIARGFVFDTINGAGFSRWPHKEDPNVQNPSRSMADEHQQYPIGNESLADVIWKTFVLNVADADGLKAPANWGDLFYQKLFCPEYSSHPSHELWYKQNKDLRIYGVTLEEITKQQRKLRPGVLSREAFAADKTMTKRLEQLMAAFDTAVTYRRLATTESGYLCLAPSTSQPGDSIVILFDCHVPVVLRREEGHCKFIGTCYVHGIMQGEAMDWLSVQPSEAFVIR